MAQLQPKDEPYISCFGFSHDDHLVAAVGTQSLWVWNVDSGGLVTRLDCANLAYSVCFTEDNAYVVLEGPLEELTTHNLVTGADNAVDDRHRQAFAIANGRDPDGWQWYLPNPRPIEGQLRADIEMTLLNPQGKTMAWLPFRYGYVYHHPLGQIWAVLREGQFYLLAVEGVGK